MSFTALTPPASVSFTHGATYVEGRSRGPIVDVELAAVDQTGVLMGATTTGCLLDTGAPWALFPLNIAVLLGLDLTREDLYPRAKAHGVVSTAAVRVACVDILVGLGGRWLRVPARFHVDMHPVPSLLGRNALFDEFTFAFDHSAERVLLT